MKRHYHLQFFHISAVALGLWLSAQMPLLAQPTSASAAFVAVRSLDNFIITPDLPPLQPILPITNEVRLELSLGQRRLTVYQGEQELKSYSVAIGRPGWETPVGEFEVVRMVKYPVWVFPEIIDPQTGKIHASAGSVVPPGPENPLGERWIGFTTSGRSAIGFHGTPNPESIGQAASHGCVRMYNPDVRELFDLIQLGTPVIVRP